MMKFFFSLITFRSSFNTTEANIGTELRGLRTLGGQVLDTGSLMKCYGY